MTLSEFNAWLEGYSASFKDGHPNAEQWTQIVNRLANVTPLYIPNPDPIRQAEPFQPVPPAYFGTPYWLQPVTSANGDSLDA